MKITNVRTLLMDASYMYFNIDYLFVLIETNEGIAGLGEATNWPGCPMVDKAIQEMKPFLIGRDPMEIESLVQALARRFHYIGIAGVAPTAISGIEIALWDLMGKKLGVPVYQLLGGRCQPRVKTYANYWAPSLPADTKLEEWSEAALEMVRAGYDALKFTPIPFPGRGEMNRTISWSEIRKGVKRVAAVREAVGEDVELYIELAGKFDVPTAIEIGRALEPYRIGFIEEPIPPEDPHAMADVRRKVGIPVAGGERVYGRHGFRPFLEAHAFDIIQPDVMRTGGLFETRKIAALAETYYIPVAPHNAGGPVGTIATLHVAMATPNFEILEFRVGDVPWRDTVIKPAIKIENGIMQIPPGPGLGIELIEAEARKHPHVPVEPKGLM
ncbi:MAG: mandelate racemase/muconate lactonizing enzyme family protein [Candidatus Sumerlaeota bacterium]|nr:mandelate racemase/muconate lactonizing enzyme family protein [Candidatus Sumerlaeota bacterium]